MASGDWCEFSTDRASFKFGTPCNYPTQSEWRGWKHVTYVESNKTDCFLFVNDCCGADRVDTTKNYLFFDDTADTPNKYFYFKHEPSTANGRKVLNLDFWRESKYSNTNYIFDLDGIPEYSTLYQGGRVASDSSTTTLMLHKVIVYFTVNDTFHENIILDYKENIPPFLLIDGDASVTIKTNYYTPKCTYHYSTKGIKTTIKTPISGKVSATYQSYNNTR
ncbi:hypothetical protein EDI_201580 [Entamoeba dispar SAW760]|uniref:Uncharacterized protein n=1 Tax=Entamoeba dispar (strain ATCC PRA-260 / SAW760) TaxID=370354 RepID=B0ETY5_ENTDS|nr:uncharacterized protein EDI_201580 [Entamoeba dispar SAW760]EDR22042.1 hypothetical protein EDI_201580 [Entamoeba dispar SAW760]|eukprot:EDR22042.1 hypothetical protein EDI_201580 [Entamoeba dispar SAW760]